MKSDEGKSLYASKKVLLVDDSSTIRSIISNELIRLGFTQSNIKGVSNGKLALEYLMTNMVDMIISDWNMPDMNGLVLLRTIKENKTLSTIPFLMVTSETDSKKKEEVFESGADQFITKPFNPATLEKTVQLLLTQTCIFKGKKALVVDDSSFFRKIVIKNLIQAGFTEGFITEANDGEEALASLTADIVDLVVTDWNMPKMDGLELTKRIRANNHLKHLPVLMITSEAQKEKIVEASSSGISGYILKPFNAADMQEKVKATLK